MKTKDNNDVIDHIDVVYAENKTEPLWLIGLGVISDENKIGQWRDWS